MKDLFGKAILDYQTNNFPENLVTETSISEPDELAVSYLFRSYDAMPILEQTALNLSTGEVLDIGCGAGSHSLFLQNDKSLNVTSIDISLNAIRACRLRGLKNAIVSDIMMMTGTYDTILLLMNGAGMCGKLNRMPLFLEKLKSMLAGSGQILMDSSDIIYMFDKDDISKNLHQADGYYGEVKYLVSYKGLREKQFDWLYIDYDKLKDIAKVNGLKCELVLRGSHYDYLAKLTL